MGPMTFNFHPDRSFTLTLENTVLLVHHRWVEADFDVASSRSDLLTGRRDDGDLPVKRGPGDRPRQPARRKGRPVAGRRQGGRARPAAQGRPRHRLQGQDRRAGLRRHARAPARAGPRGPRDDRHRDARRGRRRRHERLRHPQYRSGRRHADGRQVRALAGAVGRRRARLPLRGPDAGPEGRGTGRTGRPAASRSGGLHPTTATRS